MDLSEYRRNFTLLQKKIYLNTCSLGALSDRSKQYVHTFLDQWEEYGASAWYSIWIYEIETVRKMIARLLHADEDEIAFGHSISTLLSSVASCLRFNIRKKIVATDLDFPTANYQWLAKEPSGVHTEILRSPDRVHIPLSLFHGTIDAQTALVSTSHVFFTSGKIQDIASINAAARRYNALCIFDAYQSAGQIPINVHEMGIDMLVSGGLKWLLGGPGITFLYVRKELIDTLRPTSPGWFGVKSQFEFTPDRFELLENARRLETGTPALSALFALKGGLEIVLEIGVENIRAATKKLTEELIDRLKKAGFSLRIATNPDERAAIVMIHHPNPAPIVDSLRERNIIVDFRNDYIRVSPYFYNTSRDLEIFVSTLQDLT